MIVWIASYPGSGNSLFRDLIRHYLDLPTYSVYRENGYEYWSHDNGQLQFVKTHRLPKDDDYQAIYIVRDKNEAYAAYARKWTGHGKTLLNGTYESALKMFTDRDAQPDHVKMWKDRSVTVRFEYLVNPELQEHVFRRALDAVGLGKLTLLRRDPMPTRPNGGTI